MTCRRALLLLPLLLAGCAGEPQAVRTFAPISYGHLTPLRLNVGEVEVLGALPPGPAEASSPAPLGETLRRVGTDRLAAGGSAGRGVFAVNEATVTRAGNTLSGQAVVHLDILGMDGARAGFAEARVSRSVVGVGRGAAYQGALYDLTRQIGDDMTVEFEFQVRRSLRDWLQDPTTAPPPAPVEQQELTAPGV